MVFLVQKNFESFAWVRGMRNFEYKVYSTLIVVDDEINLEILSDHLEVVGLEVMTVADGESAVKVLDN